MDTSKRPPSSAVAVAVAGEAYPGYVDDATPEPISHRPCRRARGRGSRPAQPNSSAPRRRHPTRFLLLNSIPCSGSTGRFVADPQFDRVDPGRDRQFVHRGLQREHAGAFTRRPHPGRNRDVEVGDAVPGATVLRGVHHPGGHHHLLDELHVPRALHDRVVVDRPQPAVGVRAEPDPLDGRGSVADQRELVLPGEDHPHRPAEFAGGHGGQDDVRARQALGPEPAADVRTDHPDPFHRHAERPGDGLPDRMATLVRVIEGELTAGEDGGGRVRLHRIVVQSRGACRWHRPAPRWRRNPLPRHPSRSRPDIRHSPRPASARPGRRPRSNSLMIAFHVRHLQLRRGLPRDLRTGGRHQSDDLTPEMHLRRLQNGEHRHSDVGQQRARCRATRPAARPARPATVAVSTSVTRPAAMVESTGQA